MDKLSETIENSSKSYDIFNIDDLIKLCEEYKIGMSRYPFEKGENEPFFAANPRKEYFCSYADNLRTGNRRWLESNQFDEKLIQGGM